MQPASQHKDLQLYLTGRCFEACVETFKDKFLNPYQKQCMEKCLGNMRGFLIQNINGYNTK